ncbi:hypothetical protein [Petroclostridium xylanilyticum]|jgi:hypothetical protein|uniref:hypothetical protein n=1 Tax=Petroclostridium xylanilyticum TaxID=1792311 RepID=UPI000B9954AE|nr:hypothetical protein [Petroclostridium xylanilyticum]
MNNFLKNAIKRIQILIESVAASVAVAKLRNGKFKNIEKIDMRAWYLLIIAAFIEFVSVYFNRFHPRHSRQ